MSKSNHTMNKLLTTTLFLLSFTARADYWTQKADFGGTARWIATGFSINGKGYIGTGVDNTTGPRHYTDDFWEFDPVTNTWTQMATFGGTARWGSVAFSIGAKGYITGGFDGNILQQDLWEWDQASNTWSQKASLPATGREFFAGFSIGSKGYVGTGYSQNRLRDFWEWDQATNTWTQKANFGGTARQDVVGFSVGNKGYIATGYDGSLLNDLWEWDPISDTWTQKANVGGGRRNVASAFSFCNYGFIGTGVVSGVRVTDFWQWNQVTNTWTRKADFGGTGREHAVGFSINNLGYIGTGGNGDSGLVLFSDFWEYTPETSCAIGIEELAASTFTLTAFPNPATDMISVNSNQIRAGAEVVVFDVHGELCYRQSPSELPVKIEVRNFAAGTYTIQVRSGGKYGVTKFVKN